MTPDQPAPPAAFVELRAPPDWRAIELISDLHLSELQPATFEAFAQYLHSTAADAVLILGDLFEVWVGDDSRVAGTFAARAAAILTEASRERSIGFMAGNRDFLVGEELLGDCGLIALSDPMVLDSWGERIVLTHGDALCLADKPYQAFRAQVRSLEWRRNFLAQPLAEREQAARAMRDASEAAKRRVAPGDWADVDAAAAMDWLRAADSKVMVHGHTHRPASEMLAPGFTRHVLSDWDCDALPRRAQVLRVTREGITRHALA